MKYENIKDSFDYYVVKLLSMSLNEREIEYNELKIICLY